MKKIIALFAVFTLGFLISACAPQEDDPLVCDDGYVLVDDECVMEEEEEQGPTENIIETAAAAGSFSTLLAALDEAGLTSALEAPGEFTVFAPTDEAFTALLTALDIDAATLLGIENLSDILLYHVLEGTYMAEDVVANAPFSMETMLGSDVNFTVMDGTAYINGVEIVTTDIETTNGVIHVIDEVILPLDNIVATATAEGSFTTLLAALDEAGLTSTLEGAGSYTVFAPTDDAFADLLTALDIDAATLLGIDNLSDVLLYHVLDGAYYSTDVVAAAPFTMSTLEGTEVEFMVMDGNAYINGVQIVTTDILTTNGVIHVIEEVLLPLENIVATAEAAGSFSTLLAALDAAGLTNTLAGDGVYTVFAPTDAAFIELLSTLDLEAATLLGVENLSDVLLYHVLDGAYYSTDVVANAPFSMTTLQGSDVNFTVMDGKAYINGIEITTTDILTSNGVIHVIDGVVLPLDNIVETAEAAGSFTTLLAAIDTAGLTSTLESGNFTVFAPTDDAFAALLSELGIDAATLLADPDLASVLTYHVLEGSYFAGDVVANAPFAMETVNGGNVYFTVMDGNAYINGIMIETTDILTTNGIIHVVDEVILPLDNIVDTADAAGSFSTLLAALDEAGLTATLEGAGNFTVFAPTDAAFVDLLTALDIDAATLLGVENLADVLLYHVLDGAYFASDVVAGAPFSLATLEGSEVDFSVMDGKAYINGAEIVTTDIYTSNGIIHVIDAVILPLDNIVATATDEGSFTTLLAALDTAGLTSTLEAGNYTVFAPTDDAFATLLSDLGIDAATLLADPDLANILLYHVLDGSYFSGDVVANAPFSMATLNGGNVYFTVMDGDAYINGVMIDTTDILTTNGVIHVIEEVILPLDNIVETATAAGSFSTLLAALDEAGLTATLEGDGNFTVFAPTDAAFTDLLTALGIDAATLLGIENLSDVLLYHVFSGDYYASDVVSGAPFSLTSLQGSDVDFTVVDGKAYINGAEIVTTDILTANGVIHVIDDVILPLDNIVATAEAAGSFSTLLAAVDTAGLTSTLEGGNYTVFAPTDDAFAALLSDLGIDAATLLADPELANILLYHVLDGSYFSGDVVAGAPFSMATVNGGNVYFTVMDGNAYINGVMISTTDILTTNGVIHVIDEVILPLDNIVDTATAAGSFSTLLTALDTAGLTATLEGDGNFTVFAPTDAAFADLLTALGIDAATLLGVENLSDILLYHVLNADYYASDVVAGAPFSLTTLEGSDVDFTVVDGTAYINGAEIVTTDILTSNGVIHVIDAVILPLEDIVATAEAAGSFSTLLAALDQEGLTATLQGTGPFTVFAPTNDAFDALLVELNITLNDLLALGNLDQILLYHVISGSYYSTDVVAAAPLSLASVQGTNLDFTVVDGTIFVSGIEVVTEDILTSNGVIHVISGVLLYE